MAESLQQFGYMFLLALQFGLQPFLTNYCVDRSVYKPSIVLACELVKFALSLVFLVRDGATKSCWAAWTIRSSLWCAALPAAVYSLQNILVQVAYGQMDALTFNLVNQSKLIWTALFAYFIAGKKQSAMQCVALCLLLVGATILSLDGQDNGMSRGSMGLGIHVAPCVVASFLSGFAAGLSQRALQDPSVKRNSYVFSMELSVYSSIILLAGMAMEAFQSRIALVSYFHGWTPYTFVPIFTNACGGIIVGLVTKYAGGVRKGVAIIIGLLLTATLRLFLGHAPVTAGLLVAGPVVVLGTLLHSMFPYEDDKMKRL